MATIEKIINEMMAGDLDSYNLFKDKVISYIDSHYPDIPHNDYEDIFENIIEDMIVNNEKLKSNNMHQYVYRLINSNIKKYNKDLEAESSAITKLNEDIYYSEDLIFDQIYKTELIAQIYELLNTLTERERKVIQYRFYGSSTLEETGKRFGVSRERIRQLEAKALRKLRHPMRRRKLKDFFDDNNYGINDIYGQNISRDYYIDNYYLNQIKHGLKSEEEIFNRIQEEIESGRKEKVREEKLVKERKEEKLKSETFEEISETKKAYINYLREQKKRKEKEQIDREKQIIDNYYGELITDYVSKLKQTADLISEVMLNTEGDKRELYNIITNFYGISYEQYKQNIEDFYEKHRKR